MEVKATYKYARVSPKKARDVARVIQGMPVSSALDALTYSPRKASQLINKTLKSAIANAENNHELIADDLTVKQAVVGDGPTFKRFKPRARGSASAIRKRTSHLFIVLTDEEEIPEPKERKTKSKKKKTAKKKTVLPKNQVADKKEAKTPDLEKLDRGKLFDSPPEQVNDLKKISGVGEGLEKKLNEFGIYTYEQVANWSEENIAAFDHLLSFKGRIERDNWLDQAKELMKQENSESS